jgi:CBS domain-containing protein
MGQIGRILQRRSPVVHIVTPDQSVAEAVAVMASYEVGAVLVVQAGKLVGIFSERDVLRRVIAKRRDPATTRVGDVMTCDPVTAEPGEKRLDAVSKMQAVGCRHLPVVVESSVIDMLSMRDLLFDELEERTGEVESLRRYIDGSY